MTCTAIATTTGRSCRQRALPGGALCPFHQPADSVECVGGPSDGATVSIRDARWCRMILAAAGPDGAVALYRPHPRFAGEVLGVYRLVYLGPMPVWRWERAADPVHHEAEA